MSYAPPHGRLPKPIKKTTGRAGISPFPAASDHEHPYKGVPGDGGGGGAQAYTHTQAVASATWVIDHNLSFRPNVAVVDSTGDQVEGEVEYTDADTVTVKFTAAFTGTAYLS